MANYKTIDVSDFLETYPDKKLKYNSPSDLKCFFEKYIQDLNYEQHFMFGLNENKEIILAANNTEKAFKYRVEFNSEKDIDLLKEHGCSYFIFCHNHPFSHSEVIPSDVDKESVLKTRFESVKENIIYLDDIIIGSRVNDFYYHSHAESGFLKPVEYNLSLLKKPEYSYEGFNPEGKYYCDCIDEYLSKNNFNGIPFIFASVVRSAENNLMKNVPVICSKCGSTFDLNQFIKDTEQLGICKINLAMWNDDENVLVNDEYIQAFKKISKAMKAFPLSFDGTLFSRNRMLPVFNARNLNHPESFGIKKV